MKAVQDENATTSPRDMHKAKERKRDKGKIVKISAAIGPGMRLGCWALLVKVVTDWACQVVGKVWE